VSASLIESVGATMTLSSRAETVVSLMMDNGGFRYRDGYKYGSENSAAIVALLCFGSQKCRRNGFGHIPVPS
jgi:hypothetical protein